MFVSDVTSKQNKYLGPYFLSPWGISRNTVEDIRLLLQKAIGVNCSNSETSGASKDIKQPGVLSWFFLSSLTYSIFFWGESCLSGRPSFKEKRKHKTYRGKG